VLESYNIKNNLNRLLINTNDADDRINGGQYQYFICICVPKLLAVLPTLRKNLDNLSYLLLV
jgi:hypothetical protein